MEQKNDTHGAAGEGWYGFDLDGTLAKYDKWEGIDHIGEPIVPMVELIKQMHDEGKTVKILTARVSPRSTVETAPTPYPLYAGVDVGDVPIYAAQWMSSMRDAGHVVDQVEACKFYLKANWTARDFVADWCLKTLGFLPDITHEKDHLMLELFDDRVKQVIPNTGVLVEEIARDAEEQNLRLRTRLHRMIDSEVEFSFRLLLNRGCAFFFGCVSALIAIVLLEVFVLDTDESEKVTAARELHDAACRYLRVTRESLPEKIQKDNLTPVPGL